MSGSKLIRWAGLLAMVSGVLQAVAMILHPENDPSAVLTPSWAFAHYLVFAGSVLGLLAATGLYARQVKEAGILGLIGFLMFYIQLVIVAIFAFFEAPVLPLFVAEATQFVEGFFGVLTGGFGSGSSLGVLQAVYAFQTLLWVVGGLLFGIAIFRTGRFPRLAVLLFAIGPLLAVLSALWNEDVAKFFFAVAWLSFSWMGYVLWIEKPVSEKFETKETGLQNDLNLSRT